MSENPQTDRTQHVRIMPAFSRMLRLQAPSRADIIALLLLAGLAAMAVRGAEGVAQPLSHLRLQPVTIDPANLPGYALRTTLRMFAALLASLLFTLTYATLAAKSRWAEQILIPALDILQSVPILGFLTFTVTFFMNLFPGETLGVECAAVFAIFTSQAWNMAFSFYQSLRTVPADLIEVSQGFGLSPVRRFLRLELPFATPSLVWNAMMSMSGGWFFVVASEAITVGNTTVTLPGIGSYLALAIQNRDFHAVAYAVGAMGVVILIYDQLVFRPVVWLIGVPWGESGVAAELMATKTVLNEFVAYLHLSQLPPGRLSPHAALILTYAMCGFANFGSLGIMLGGMGAMVPASRPELMSLGLRTILSGTIATCLSGAVAGLLV